MDRAAILKALRTPVILAIIVGTVVVFLIWLLAIFLPQGSKVNKLNAEASSLQAQQTQLNDRLHQLERLKNSNLQKLHTQYTGLVPATANTSTYLKQINAVIAQAGVTLTSVSIAPPAPPAGSAVSKGALSQAFTINVSLAANGTYDQQLKLIQDIYAMKRLTTISNVILSGGGASTNRSTSLTGTYTMTIYELPTAAETTTTTAAA